MPGRQDFAGAQVDEAAFAGAVHGLRTIEFPAQAVVHGQLLGDAPGVLPIEEPAILCLAGIVYGADVALEELHVAQQERGQTGTAAVGSLRAGGIEVELPGAVLVAGDAQVVGAADVGAELEGVIALDLGPVVDELILIFILDRAGSCSRSRRARSRT